MTPQTAVRPQTISIESKVTRVEGGERASTAEVGNGKVEKNILLNEDENEVILIPARGYGKSLGRSKSRGATLAATATTERPAGGIATEGNAATPAEGEK